MKFGLWIVIGVVAFLWFTHAKKQRARDRARGAPAAVPPSAVVEERIVACAHCGLHVPASDAIISETGAMFCSVAHRGQPPRA